MMGRNKYYEQTFNSIRDYTRAEERMILIECKGCGSTCEDHFSKHCKPCRNKYMKLKYGMVNRGMVHTKKEEEKMQHEIEYNTDYKAMLDASPVANVGEKYYLVLTGQDRTCANGRHFKNLSDASAYAERLAGETEKTHIIAEIKLSFEPAKAPVKKKTLK